MTELLLLSNSTAPGMRFLEHASQAVRVVLGSARTVLFVPFASGDPDAYTSLVRAALARMDIRVTGLHEASDVPGAVRAAEAVFVGGGNSFRLLRALIGLGILDALRGVAENGVPYLGASAG